MHSASHSTSSGLSTPFSSSSTLSCPTSPTLKYSPAIKESVYKLPLISASNLIELIASRAVSTSTVYIYDLAEQAGFGTLTKLWAGTDSETSSVERLQSRPGAGRTLVGRLSEGTSRDTMKGAVLTAYTTPAGLSLMAPALSYLPAATPSSRLVIQVPRAIPVGETFALSPSLAPLASSLSLLPDSAVILLSATPQESVDLTALSYNLVHSHVIHLFDHHSSTREIGHSIVPPLIYTDTSSLTVSEALQSAGYTHFDYVGDKMAETVVVLLNGPLALSAKAFAGRVPGLGVLIVRVLRPWDENALRNIIPSTARQIHVLDDVPNGATQGSLYIDVFSSLIDLGPTVRAHRIVPAQTQEFLSRNSELPQFLVSLVPSAPTAIPSSDPPNLKRLLFFSAPQSSLSHLPQLIEETFLKHQGISARLLTDHDVFSKPGGITADRMLLSQRRADETFVPIPIALPLGSETPGESDFLCILDHNLLKSHSIIKFARPGSAVLVSTSWSAAELGSNLPSEALSLIFKRQLRIYVIDTKSIAAALVGAEGPACNAVQNLVLYHAFLRMYIGSAATESLVHKIARAAFEDAVQGVQLVKIGAHAWAGLIEIVTPSDQSGENPKSSLREYEFNAIALQTEEGDVVVNGAHLGSWHDAAKHLIFPEIFSLPPAVPHPSEPHEEHPQIPSLRPEVSDRTYLVTCTVNRRLTPLEYDRNVFHVELDTSGTGLKYAIGEALGVHGWNDEGDVLDFCAWYGVDPDRLITIPVSSGDGKQMHTRTVLQALQQQIDLFGRPPKSFYTDLAAHATSLVDKYALLFIGSPEGSATFKKLAEKDTVNFADILRMYPSARPGVETLCEMIGDCKPRHYSIASAQSVVGDRVDLLVVTVDWVTPSGESLVSRHDSASVAFDR
jgi:sulfite reductase (NADPH) flavoprotein alpha-component